MATLQDHIILFDAECPMCGLYTKAFVKAGLLNKQGRVAYQTLAADTCPMVNRQRAVNEITLVNQQTGEVTYGVMSLFKILGTAIPALKRLFGFAPFIWLMAKLYAFISYNRRVIIPTAGDGYPVQPAFKMHYRIAYLVFAWAVTSIILSNYVYLLKGVLPVGNAYREYLICGGQIFFQGVIASLMFVRKRWDYLGNMMTISLAGSLLLLPIVLLADTIGRHPVFYSLYFMLIAGLMFLEHIRRSKLLKLGWALNVSWASYRAVILLAILYL